MGRIALLLSPALAFATPASAQELAFDAPGPLTSDTGHVLVEWEAPGPVTLVMARNDDFTGAKPLYHGDNRAYFISGLEGGDYFLLLRDEAGSQSDPIHLTVAHQSLQRAIWLTIIGAIITLGIIATIIRGARP